MTALAEQGRLIQSLVLRVLRSDWWCMGTFGQLRQAVELHGPHLLECVAEWTERLEVGAIEAALAVAADADEAGVAEDAEVLRNGAEADVDALGDVAGGELAIPDESEDFASSWFGDDLEGIDG